MQAGTPVKVLHTSDWHIGRRFEREPLEADQRAFLSWLAGEVGELEVDLVLVAGDVYDRSLPSEEAVALLDEGLDQLRAAGATVAVIPGNHDSARRLGFGARRQALGGVHVFADDCRPPVPWLFESRGDVAAVVAVPFLDPLVSPAPRAADGSARARTHANVLSDFVGAGRDGLARFPGVPSLAVAHAFVAGAAPSDSEKILAIGGTDLVDASIFAGFDYVALGHLHRPQLVGGDERIAYSGSPIAYSFSEGHPKSVRLVDIADGRVAGTTTLPVPVGRPVATIQGTLESLLFDPAYDDLARHWIAARLTDDTTQVQALERLRSRFPFAVSVRYAPSAAGAPGWPGARDLRRLAAGSPGQPGSPEAVQDMVLAFLGEVGGRPPESWEEALVGEAMAEAGRALAVTGSGGT